MKGYFFIIILVIQVIHSNKISAEHFIPSYSGNPYNPMSILITGIAVDNESLDIGDEIGVFDGEICVGSVSYEGSDILGISVSMTDPTNIKVDGFKGGDPIHFKIWKQKTDCEYFKVNSSFDYAFDTCFKAFGSAIVKLEAFLVQQKPKIINNKTFSVLEGSPNNSSIGIVDVDYPSKGNLRFSFLDTAICLPFQIDSITGLISVSNNLLLDYTVSDLYLVSVLVHLKNNTTFCDTSTCQINVIRIPPSLPSIIPNDTVFVGQQYRKIIEITKATSNKLSVIPANIPSWLSLKLINNKELTFDGIPGNQDIGESKVSFILSDGTNDIQQSFDIETIQEGKRSNVVINNNPSNGPFTLFIYDYQGNEVKINIRELNGQLIYQKIFQNEGGRLIVPIDLSGKITGLYLIEIILGVNTITKKICLQ